MHKFKVKLEAKMDEYLVKKAPFQLPENGKKAIVKWAPYIALVVGVLSLLSALSLWKLARDATRLLDYTSEFSRTFGVESTVARDVGMMVYLSIVVVAVQGVILLLAYNGLQAKSKSNGWDLLLLSSLLGLLYSVSTLFIGDFRTFGDFLFSALGALVGLYILAQIKSYYKSTKKSARS